MLSQPSKPDKSAPIPSRAFNTIKPGRVRWYWEGYLPIGTLTIIEGRKGSGKSTVAAAIAASVSGGPKLTKGKHEKPSRVCWLSNEEDYETCILPRLASAGAKLERISYPTSTERPGEPRRVLLPSDAAMLSDYVTQEGITLLVLDPLSSFVDSSLSLHDEQSTRACLEPLSIMARRSGCSVLMIRHVRKSSHGPALDQGLGSVAIGNVARVVLRTYRDEHNPDQHYLACVATNATAMPPTLMFSVRSHGAGARAVWDGTTERTAEDLAESQGDAAERSAMDDAKRFLVLLLEKTAVEVSVIKAQSEKMGISPRTLRRAKIALSVTSEHVVGDAGQHWAWQRPEVWPPE